EANETAIRGHTLGRARDLGADGIAPPGQDPRIEPAQVPGVAEHQRVGVVLDRREALVAIESALLGLHLQRQEPFDLGGSLAAANVDIAALRVLAGRIEVLQASAEAVEMLGRIDRGAHVGEQALAARLGDQRALELPAAAEQVAVLEADLATSALLAAVADAEDGALGLVLDQVDRQGYREQLGIGLERIELGHHADTREIATVAQRRLIGEQLLERVRLAGLEGAQVLHDSFAMALETRDLQLPERNPRAAVEHHLDLGRGLFGIDPGIAAGDAGPQVAALVERIDEAALASFPFAGCEETALGQQPA